MTTKINATTTTGVILSPDNSGSLELQTNNGTTAITIDTSQNVGIGTTSPSVKLNVYGSGGGTIARLQTGTTANGNFLDYYNASSSRQGIVGFVDATNLYIHNDASAAIIFDTANTERMRIDSSGNVSITQTAGKYTIDTTGGATSIANGGTVDFPNASGMLIVNSSNTGGVSIYLFGGGATATIGSVVGAVGSTAYNAGIAGYRWTNNSGSTGTFGFFFLRTRATA